MKLVYWYDRHTRSWVIQLLDAEGNQIGDADYVGDKVNLSSTLKYYERTTGRKAEKYGKSNR